MLELEELKQIFKEQEDTTEREQLRQELERERLELAKLKRQEQQIKVNKMQRQEPQKEPQKNSNGLYVFTCVMMLAGLLAPFIALIVLLLKF